MKTISNDIKNAFKTPTTKRKGVILVNGNYYDVYNVEYNADCYDEGNVIGNAIASQLDFDIPYMPKFNTFQYFDCIWVGNDYEYIDFGTFNVFDEQDQDTFNKHITAFDNLIKFNLPFVDQNDYPKTLYDELSNVCEQAGIVLANSTIPNGSFVVTNNQFVNGESLKTVLKQICSISGNYAIVKNNMLYLQLRNSTNEVITKNQHEPVDWKRRSYGINQVIIGDSQIEGEYVIREDPDDIALNGIHKLEILDNLFAYTQDKRNALIDNLFNQVRGFGYIPFETKGEWLSYLEIGDTIKLDGTDTILLRINAKSPDSLNTTISAPAIIDSSLEYKDNTNDVNNRLKRTEISVDKQNQKIASVVSSTAEQNTKISQITQTVDEINSKIQDIADISVSGETTLASLELNNVLNSIPILIKIHPMLENIDYLYPSDSLFPSATLYPKIRTLRFINTRTNETFDYEIPIGLLIYDSETYDELYISGDSETCQVIKRCKYNNDGTVGILEEEQTITYPFPYNELNLTDGDYTIQLLGYDSAYMYVRLLAETLYTTMYPTKIEMKSEITQTKNDITLEVDEKLADYSTTTQMNSAITVKANEITSSVSETYATKTTTDSLSSRIKQTAKSIELVTTDNNTSAGITIRLKNEDGTQIDSKSANITLSGKVSFTDLNNSGSSTFINGANINTGTITANKLNINTLSAVSSNLGTITGGSLTIGNYFKVTSSGVITASNGKIGGCTIDSSGIYSGSGNSTSGIGLYGSRQAFWAGSSVSGNGSAPFRVDHSGYLTATNATIKGTITSSTINGSSINGGTMTSSTIKVGNSNGGGSFDYYNGIGYLNCGVITQHPYVSGLNIATGGISFTNGTSRSSVGSSWGGISLASGDLLFNSSNGDARIRGFHVKLEADGSSGNVYARRRSGSYQLVSTSGGDISSKNLKKNIKIFNKSEYEDAYKLLQNIDMYRFNYKYNGISDNKNEYGFIIDYIEENKNYDKFLYFEDERANVTDKNELDYLIDKNSKNVIDFKKYDKENIIKYLFTLAKTMQIKIDELERKINNE